MQHVTGHASLGPVLRARWVLLLVTWKAVLVMGPRQVAVRAIPAGDAMLLVRLWHLNALELILRLALVVAVEELSLLHSYR